MSWAGRIPASDPDPQSPDLQRKDGGLVADVTADDVRLDGQHPRRPLCSRPGRSRSIIGAHDRGLRNFSLPVRADLFEQRHECEGLDLAA